LQFWIIVGAIGLAVAGAVAMGIVGVRLQDLARSETQRRLETVAARREVRAILRGTADGLIGLDLDGCCTFLNEAGSRMLGYSPRDLQGERVHGLIHHTRQDGSEHPESECPARLSAGSGVTVRIMDEILWRKDGTSFPVQLIVSPMTDGLEVRGVVLTFTDMTEMRAAEDALREAVQARDEVLAVVSHDLRNPVGTIAAAAELLGESGIPAERQTENLDIIQRSADRINRLIQDLLDVAQIEAGRLSVRSAALDLSEVIEDVVSQARLQASFKNIQVASEVPESLPSVEADRDRVFQVLANLIDNALKFTPDGGSVTVSASPALEGVSIAVADTGPGIAPEQRDHLFDRFWKGHRASGAGLGLAIVKGILLAHGADIRVETEVGSGSVFSFTLRLAD
jgi:PAS domain S-box-containing protein